MFYFARGSFGQGHFPDCCLVSFEGLQYFILFVLFLAFCWFFFREGSIIFHKHFDTFFFFSSMQVSNFQLLAYIL